jgi:hypothetical protein
MIAPDLARLTRSINPRKAFRHRPALALAVLAFALTLSGCAATQDVQVRRETQQTFAPSAIVEVLSQAPSQPFVRIAVLDAQAPAGTPLAQVLAQLQAKAGALGANAIVVQNLSTQEGGSLQYNPSGGSFSNTPAVLIPHLRCIAIRIEH